MVDDTRQNLTNQTNGMVAQDQRYNVNSSSNVPSAFQPKPNPLVQAYQQNQQAQQQGGKSIANPSGQGGRQVSPSGTVTYINQGGGGTSNQSSQGGNVQLALPETPQEVADYSVTTRPAPTSYQGVQEKPPTVISSLKSTGTGYVQPYTINDFPVNLGFSLFGSKTTQFKQRQDIISNVASKPQYKSVSPFLYMSSGLGYEEFFKSKVEPIVQERTREYNILYAQKKSEVDTAYSRYQSGLISGEGYKAQVAQANLELSKFEYPDIARDVLGQPISKRPEWFNVNKNIPSAFQPTPNIQEVSETQKQAIQGTLGSEDFNLLQKGYKEIGTSQTIQQGVKTIVDQSIQTYGSIYAFGELGNTGLLKTDIGATSFKGLGIAQTVSGGIKQNIVDTAQGLVLTGGTFIPESISLGEEMRVSENRRMLTDTGFKFQETKFDTEAQQSFISGARSYGGLRQELNIQIPSVTKQGEIFYAPGEYETRIAGVIKPDLVGVQKDIFYIGYQTGRTDAKGFSLPTPSENVISTMGKQTFIPKFETSSYGYSTENFLQQFKSNVKFFNEKEFTSKQFIGLTESLGKGFDINLGEFEKYRTISGEINKLEINPERYLSYGGEKINLSPEDYALYLQGQGKLKFTRIGGEGKKSFKQAVRYGFVKDFGKNLGDEWMFTGTRGLFGSGSEKYKPQIITFSEGTFNQYKLGDYQTVISHELIHYKTASTIDSIIGRLNNILPYRLNPNEIVAFGGEKYFAEKGFNVKTPKGSLSVVREGVLIDANLKDITFTRVFNPPSTEEFYVTSGSSGSSILKTSTKTQKLIPTEFITKGAVQQFSKELTPSLKQESLYKGISPSIYAGTGQYERFYWVSGGFGNLGIKMGGLKQVQELDTRKVFSFGFNKGLSNLPKSDTRGAFASIQTPGLASNLISTQLQAPKLNTKQLNQFNFQPITPTGFGGGFGGGGFGGFAIPSINFGGSPIESKKKKKAKRKKGIIAPSFTAEALDITGSLPKETAFGITPFQLRGIPRGKRNAWNMKF